MRMRGRAAAAAAGLLVLAGCDADGSAPESDPTPARSTAGPDSEHVLVTGQVTRGDDPVAGVELSLALFPDDQSDVEVGDEIELHQTPAVATGEDGEYAIVLDPDVLSSRYFNGKFLNFDLQFAADEELGVWSATAWLTRHDYWRSDDRALVGDAPMDISIDLDGPELTLTDSYGESEASDLTLMGGPTTTD
jgi:hypothetical protein